MTLFIWHSLTSLGDLPYQPATSPSSRVCVMKNYPTHLSSLIHPFNSTCLFVWHSLRRTQQARALFDYVNNTCLRCYDNQASSSRVFVIVARSSSGADFYFHQFISPPDTGVNEMIMGNNIVSARLESSALKPKLDRRGVVTSYAVFGGFVVKTARRTGDR